MLRPARLLGRLTSPRRRCTLTAPPVYGRACSNRSLPQPESAITTRPNHLLPRRDSHPFMYQRTKAAPEDKGVNGELTPSRVAVVSTGLKSQALPPKSAVNVQRDRLTFSVRFSSRRKHNCPINKWVKLAHTMKVVQRPSSTLSSAICLFG